MDTLSSRMRSLVEQGKFPGIATLVWKDGSIVSLDTVGQRDLARQLPIQRDTLFRLASMSKPLTSVAALILVDEGYLHLDDPISCWLPETADQGSIDIADEVAEVIDRHDDTRDTARVHGGLVHPGGHDLPRGRPQIGGYAAAGSQFSRNGCKDVPAVESGARPMQAKPRNPLRIEPGHQGVRMSSNHWREQSVIRGEENVVLRRHRHNLARGADAGIDNRDVHGPRRKVLECPRQPEPGLRGPMHHDLVGEIDDPRLRETRQDHSLHDPDKRPLVPEVGGNGNDA